MEKNKHFWKYVEKSADLNPVIYGRRYRLPARRGEFFFHYQDMQLDAEYRNQNFYWMHNFDVLLTNGEPIMPENLLDKLAEDGCSHFFYYSLGGYYNYEAYQHIMGETKVDFGDPEVTILTDTSGKKLARNMFDGTWRYDVAENHKNWLINPENPIGGRSSGDFGGYYGGKAFFFDFATDPDGLANYLAQVLLDFSEKSHYNGIFFDYCSSGWKGSFLPRRILDLYGEKHNCLNAHGVVDFELSRAAYDRDAGWFLYLLRSRIHPKMKVFGNQSFYSHKDYYAAIDFDITESYFVSFAYGRTGKEVYVEDPATPDSPRKILTSQTFYRGVKDSITDASAHARANIAEDTVSMGKNENTVNDITQRALPAIRTARSFKGCPKFYFLDYMIPRLVKTEKTFNDEAIYRKETDREAIFYAVTWHRLFDCDGSVSDWYGGEGRYDKDDIYFVDLGKPINPHYDPYCADSSVVDDEMKSDYVIRFFENGFALVSSEPIREPTIFQIDKSFIPEGIVGLYDTFERKFFHDASSVSVMPNYYEMLDGYVNPNDNGDIDDGFRPIGRIYIYIR